MGTHFRRLFTIAISQNHHARPIIFLPALLALCLTRFTPNATAQAAPANDNFIKAISRTGSNVVATGSNVNATKESGEPDHAGNSGGKSVWWTWQAPQTGYVTISTLGSTSIEGGPLDTILGVYTGSSVSGLNEIASNDDGPVDSTSQVSFKSIAGTTYRIAVDGYTYDTPADADSGSIALQITFATSLPLAPSWILPGTSGKMINSTNYLGDVVVLNFWATWCGPCVAEIPDLIALQQKYAPDGLTVIGVSVDDSTDGTHPPTGLVESFAAGEGMDYPIVMTRPLGYAVESAYGGISYIPNTFIIDRQNHIVQTFVGSQSYATFEKAVLPLLYSNLTMDLAVVNGQLHISWPMTQANFIVESTPDISSGVWAVVSVAVQSDGAHHFVNLPVGNSKRFFRLRLQ